ncbi:MAG: hypothetical protein ACHQDE_05645 [Acidimicrobiia bacterium]
MSTQLRLVEAPVATPRARITPPSRRAVSWGDWRLDARTRRVGRQGVAAARRALESAQAAEGLSRAS